MSETDWQPIETAPLGVPVIIWEPDQELVLIAIPEAATPIYEKEYGPRFVWTLGGEAFEKDTYFGDPHLHPTHWMPLPHPPRPQEDGTMSNTSIIWPALDAKRFAVLLRTGPLTYRLDRIAERLNK